MNEGCLAGIAAVLLVAIVVILHTRTSGAKTVAAFSLQDDGRCSAVDFTAQSRL
jgi:preprotein translocase subunit SecD